MKNILSLENLKVCIDDKKILDGVDLSINAGEVHVIMGPNGSGKSTLAYTLMGHPKYTVCDGSMTFLGQDLTKLSTDKRAKLGLFLAFQYPHEIEGVSLLDLLRQSYNSIHDEKFSNIEFRDLISRKAEELNIDPKFVLRDVNVGFSGGEKKKAEVLQLSVLSPKLVILDEIDSGLDIDALADVCSVINLLKKNNPEMTFLLITHYQRILKHIHPDFVHVMNKGKIVQSGGSELAEKLEEKGYKN